MAFTPFVFLCNAQSETGIIGQSPMSHIQCIQLPLNKAEIKKTIEKNLQTGSNELMAFERTYDEVLTSINNYERRDYNMFLNIITGFTHLLIHFNCLPTQKRNNFLMAIYNSGISLKRLLATIHTDTEPQKGFLVPIIFQYD